MPPRNIKFTIQYDGTGFHGWQRQRDVRTVQAELEKALEHLLQAATPTEGASRTDAGVHALGQVANFHADSDLPPERLLAATNARLPDDLMVVDASEVEPEFSSRFSAKCKVYRYIILNGGPGNPLLNHRALHVPGKLDTGAMAAAASLIAGRNDYSAFGSKVTEEENTVCDIHKVTVDSASCSLMAGDSDAIVRIEVKGDRFLYKMVRTIAGTLLEVGKGKLPPDRISAIIESRDRRCAGPAVKPHGLYLVRVIY